jgi:hypothetical protein
MQGQCWRSGKRVRRVKCSWRCSKKANPALGWRLWSRILLDSLKINVINQSLKTSSRWKPRSCYLSGFNVTKAALLLPIIFINKCITACTTPPPRKVITQCVDLCWRAFSMMLRLMRLNASGVIPK